MHFVPLPVQMFFSIFRHHHPSLASKVDVIYSLSQAWCVSESDEDFDMLEKRLADLAPDERILVSNETQWSIASYAWQSCIQQSQVRPCDGCCCAPRWPPPSASC